MIELFRPFLHLTNSGRRKWAFPPSVLLETQKTIFGRKYSLKRGKCHRVLLTCNLILATAENNVRAKFYGSRLKMAIHRVQYIHNITWRNSYLRVLKTCPCFMVLGLVMNNRLFWWKLANKNEAGVASLHKLTFSLDVETLDLRQRHDSCCTVFNHSSSVTLN